MKYHLFNESPFKTLISFHKIIEVLEQIAQSDIDYRSNYAKALLKEVENFPEFRTGIEDFSVIKKNETLISHLLADLFPTALTNNEIKAVTVPFQNFTFNYTERFKKILKDAGTNFDVTIRDFDEQEFYITNCCLILGVYYKQNIDFNKPFFYDIPDANGIINHYRILYNADFMEIIPSDKAPKLTQEDIDLLIDNYDDIALWKEKFPVGSWTLKGFGIIVLFLMLSNIEGTPNNPLNKGKRGSFTPKLSAAIPKKPDIKKIIDVQNTDLFLVIKKSDADISIKNIIFLR